MAQGDTGALEITSTDLVKALEEEEFDEAERLIKENTEAGYLNRGSYGVCPLNLVLSGEAGYCNLYLAQLLIRHGADVNPYVPQQMMDATPLELVVNYYLNTKAVCVNKPPPMASCPTETVIGLHREKNPSSTVLRDQLWELLSLLLAYGADPGVSVNPREPPVFHRVVADSEADMELAMRLYEAGGDFGREDVHGNTPLMDHVAAATQDASLPMVLAALSLVPDLDLNHRNCNEENMLWWATFSGSPQVAAELVRRGASLQRVGTVQSQVLGDTRLSPLFAPLLNNSIPYALLQTGIFLNPPFTLANLERVMATVVYPLVDATDIAQSIAPDLEGLLSHTSFPLSALLCPEIDEAHAAVLMFGHLKSGLQQLCIRSIMAILVKQRTKKTDTSDERGGQERKKSNIDMEDDWDIPVTPRSRRVQKMSVSDVNCGGETSGDSGGRKNLDSKLLGPMGLAMWQLDPEVVRTFVTDSLRLPATLVPRFLVEAARLQLAALFHDAESAGCLTGCDRLSGCHSAPSEPEDEDAFCYFDYDENDDDDGGFDFG